MASPRFEKGNKLRVGVAPWNKGIKTGLAPWKGKKRDPETIKKMSESMKGKFSDEKHHAWKGDNIGYSSLHQWIARKLGKSIKCEICGKKENNSYKIQWANISGQYKRDLDDWIRLCSICHHKLDDITNKGWKTRREKNGKIHTL